MKLKRIISIILALVMTLTMALNSLTVFAEGEPADDFDTLREKWQYLAMGGDYDPADPSMQGLLQSINNVAQDLLDRINPSPTTGWGANDYLWPEYILGKRNDAYADSNNTQFTIRSLKFMALAFQTKGCGLYQNEALKNEILRGLDYIYTNHYKVGVDSNPYGNWFTWEIGGPIYLLETVLLMYDYLPAELISACAATALKATTKTGGDSYMYVGANALWRDRVRMYAAILLKDSATLSYVKNDVPVYMGYVTSGDGYYADGTFMQHGNVVYNGGYGKEAFSDISHFLYMLDGSPWAITGTERDNIGTIVEKSYVPFMYNGVFMDMVRGREITRTDTTDAYAGITISLDVLLYSESVPEAEGKRFKGMIKEWMNNDNAIKTLNEGAGVAWYLFPVYNLSKTLEILKDDSIQPVSNKGKSYTFGKGVRTVHTTDKFTFGLSMYSKDIKNCEIGDSNTKGWYTGIGQTYVYTPDIGQFTYQKPTLNWYRLSGVTAVNGLSFSSHTNTNSFAGSTTLEGLYSTAGLEISSGNTQVSAKKSWFMFDDEVVALGTDISSTNNSNVETTIDNHYITKDNDLIIDGVKQPKELGWNNKIDNVTWALIEGNVEGSNIGVYFPNKSRIGAVRETRTGKWTDLGTYNVDENLQSANYLTMWVDHGSKPVNQSYAYVLLPGTSAAQVENYADSSDIEIIRQDNSVHAVYEKTLNTLGANFWKDDSESIDAMGVKDYLSVDKAATIMVKEDDNKLNFALTDTTKSNASQIMVEINREAVGVISKDSRIKVIQTSPTIRLQIDANNSVGNPIEAEFSFKPLDLPGQTAITDMSLSDDTLSVKFADAAWASAYKLVYGTESGVYTESLVTSGTTAQIRGLNANTTYYFAVKAVNDSGEGPVSEESSYVIGNTRKLTDDFADFSKTVSYSGGWAFDSSNAGTYYNGDTTRLKRNDADKTNPRRAEYITYYTPSPKDFTLVTYDYGLANAGDNTILEFYGSPDNENWTLIPAAKDGTVTKDKWSKVTYTKAGELDSSIKFIKIVVSNNTKIWAPQLSSLEINYAWTSDRVVMDTMLDDSRTYEFKGAAAFTPGDGVKFGGDKDILVKNGAEDATMLYSYTNIQNAKLTAFTSKADGGTVSFEASKDGESFTPVTPTETPQGDSGDYDKKLYSIPSLEEGTNYLRITISGEADSIAISDLSLSYTHEIAPIEKLRFRDKQLEAALNYTLVPSLKLAPTNATGEISYSISNKNIATVNSLTGALQGQELGTAVLKATVLGTETDISESINVRTSQNVALGTDTTASTTKSGYPANKATDGDYLSRWESNVGAVQWLQIDFGSPKEFDVLELNWQQYATEYVVQGSLNGTDWEPLYTEANGKGGKVWVEFDGTKKYRFVKLSGTQAPAAYSLYELRVLSFKPQSLVLQNLAIGKTATTKGNDSTNSNPAAAVDGNTDTRWASARNDNEQWYTIDLGARCNVYQVNILWEGAYGKEYDIQVYDDIANITTAVAERAGASGWKKHVLNQPVQGRYVRMQGILRGNTSYGYSMYEFEVIGNLLQTDVTSVQFASDKLSVLRGNKKSTSVITDPAYINEGSVVYVSSNPEIATVSSKGVVTGISAGTTVITAQSSVHENVSDSCEVTVTDYNGAPIPVSNLQVQGNATLIEKGTTAKFDASVSPDDASIKNIHWTSSNESVMLVTNEGLIKAIGVGTATLKGTSVANPLFVYEREIQVVDAEVETTKVLINTIGVVSLDSKADIDAARAAYNALTEEQKALVDNYAVLEAAEVRYEELVEEQKIVKVKELITAIGVVTLYSKEDIDAARAAYNALTEEQKALVDNYSVLEAAEVTYEELLSAQTVETVKELINDIGEVTLDSKTLIEVARAAYNALKEDQKLLVDNYAVLEAAEGVYAELLAAQQVETVKGLISAIGEVTLSSKGDIDAARTAYNALTEEQKALIDNYSVLEAAEARYQEVEAIEKVSSVALDKAAMSLTAGASGQLTAEIAPSTAVNKNVTWSSSNSSVATVSSSGAVTAVAEGTATITVTTEDGGKTAACNVTVTRSSGGSDNNNQGGSGTPVTPANNYTADIVLPDASGSGTLNAKLPLTVNEKTGTAVLDTSANKDLAASGGTSVITVPAIPGVKAYTLSIPVSSLTTADWEGAVKVNTTAGSITIPSNMLSGVTGAAGAKAEVTIALGDRTILTGDAKAAVGDRPLLELYLSIDGKRIEWNSTAAPVNVSIPYAPSAAELSNPERIVIWYIDDSGKAHAVPNGRYDAATGKVNFTTTHFSHYAVGYNGISFKDVPDTAWYSKAVGYVAARGITSGKGNGSFSPNAKLTRGEFLVMVMKAYGFTPDENAANNFTDAGNTYYTGYLAAAKRLGISGGVGNNMFAPGKEITRQEMFTMLYNALKAIGELPQGHSGKTLSSFEDAGRIAAYAKEAMTYFVEAGIMEGNAGQLTPASTTTRAQLAQVLYNLLSGQ